MVFSGCRALFLVGRQMADDGQRSWVHPDVLTTAEPYTQWALWVKYMRSLNRALLIVVGEGAHGETHEEIAISTVGLLGGTVCMAYFTSTMVNLVTSLNQVPARRSTRHRATAVGSWRVRTTRTP